MVLYVVTILPFSELSLVELAIDVVVHCPSVLWHCFLGHLTRKVVHELTCNVSNGMLNPTVS